MTTRLNALRTWIKWIVVAIWLLTSLAVLILTHLHFPTKATISLNTREVSLSIDPAQMLTSAEQTQFTISGPAKLSLVIDGDPRHQSKTVKTLEVDAPTAASSCTFNFIHAEFLHLPDPPPNSTGEMRVTLLRPQNAGGDTLVVRMHQGISGGIAPGPGSAKSSFVCTGMASEMGAADIVQGTLSQSASSSFRTSGAAQITLHKASVTSFQGNLHVTGRVWVERIDPLKQGHAVATLLDPDESRNNEVFFPSVSRRVNIQATDLVEVDSGNDLYIDRITARDGMQLEMRGTVKDVRIGAGSKNMESCMPSAFDDLDARKRFFALIPGIVSFVVGILNSTGLVPRRKTK